MIKHFVQKLEFSIYKRCFLSYQYGVLHVPIIVIYNCLTLLFFLIISLGEDAGIVKSTAIKRKSSHCSADQPTTPTKQRSSEGIYFLFIFCFLDEWGFLIQI